MGNVTCDRVSLTGACNDLTEWLMEDTARGGERREAAFNILNFLRVQIEQEYAE
jgi:hypothetical protein